MPFPPLLDGDHHDACGVGFVADRHGRSSHYLLETAVECLHRLDHRGAQSADGSGDGAGVLTRLPYQLLASELKDHGFEPPAPGRLGVLVVFLPPGRAAAYRTVIESALAAQDAVPITWRRVPVSPS